MEKEMRVTIESEWLLKNIHLWRGAITITDKVVFET